MNEGKWCKIPKRIGTRTRSICLTKAEPAADDERKKREAEEQALEEAAARHRQIQLMRMKMNIY